MRTVISIVLFAFMLLAGVQAGSLNVKNSCNFDIYCLAARAATEANKAGETSSITKVSAGSTYTTNGDFVAANDNVGISLKCSTSSAVSNPYQLEVDASLGTTWYDLSALDGDAFIGYSRAMGIPENFACEKKTCNPNATGCEWPAMASCNTQDAVWMYLCSTS